MHISSLVSWNLLVYMQLVGWLYAYIIVGLYRMEELTNKSNLEDQVDVHHRAYMMTEKNMVIKKPSTQCNIGMLELICDTVPICSSPCRFLDHCDLGTTRCRQRR
jgi:hypothetical protein